jgi:hypothetical protein
MCNEGIFLFGAYLKRLKEFHEANYQVTGAVPINSEFTFLRTRRDLAYNSAVRARLAYWNHRQGHGCIHESST